MKNQTVKIIRTAVLLGFIFSVLVGMVNFGAECDELKNNVLRLHIIANSNSQADQELKLKIRDAILQTHCAEFEKCSDINEATLEAEKYLPIFKQVAQQVISENGFNYPVDVSIEKTFFETRVYDEFSLPAGEYDALCIKIGNAAGKNWWCVMFPALCVPSATDANLQDAVSFGAANIASNYKKYIFRFKTVEIFEEIKKNLLNK